MYRAHIGARNSSPNRGMYRAQIGARNPSLNLGTCMYMAHTGAHNSSLNLGMYRAHIGARNSSLNLGMYAGFVASYPFLNKTCQNWFTNGLVSTFENIKFERIIITLVGE